MTFRGNPLRITASILCYNYGRFLEQAIESCLNQTRGSYELEILVLDDGSTDETPEVCAQFGSRIRVSRTENLGFGATLARAFNEARGDYVALLDADDWWHPEKLNTIVSSLRNDTLYVRHPMMEVNEDGNDLGRTGACGNTSSLFVEKNAAVSLLPGTSELFCTPIFDLGRGIELKMPLAFYRIHGKSMTIRGPHATHTAFFSKTTHFTADRLNELSLSPPSWINDPCALSKLSNRYRAEAYTKDFEHSIELGIKPDALQNFFKMAIYWMKHRGMPEMRHFRLILKAIRTALFNR